MSDKIENLKETLTDQQYKVTQEGMTEAPFSGEYYDTKDAGMYSCVVCGHQLFGSDTKIDHKSYEHLSGLAGWPSFDDALPGAIEFRDDDSHGMVRTEAVCANCGAHLGHVFDDPDPQNSIRLDGKKSETGKHYCINSCALKLNKE